MQTAHVEESTHIAFTAETRDERKTKQQKLFAKLEGTHTHPPTAKAKKPNKDRITNAARQQQIETFTLSAHHHRIHRLEKAH